MPTTSLSNHLGSLPVSLTPLIGRDQETASVVSLLRRENVHLVTLTGTGGVGKTRLALRVAAEVRDSFPDGVTLVPLGAVADPTLVAAAVARALGMNAAAEPLIDQLVAYLRDKQTLIVVDNFEHLVSAAPLLAELLANSPGLKLLVTSRAVLRLSGERVLTVPPLTLPTYVEGTGSPSLTDIAQSDAVRLFVDRAQATRADFTLTEANAAAVAEVCARLDGLPLAIELAAARASVLPPDTLLNRMERRLPVLTAGTRDAPTRQQTMRAAIAWSYDLLTPEEQTLFRRLSVFAGGFTLDAAEAVAAEGAEAGGRDGEGDESRPALAPSRPPASFGLASAPPRLPASSVLDDITSLVEKSLLQLVAPSETRFSMLETIREFGLEHLAATGEEEAVRSAHATYLLTLAERAEPHLFGPDQALWLDRLEQELPNIRSALGWLRERGRAEEGLRLATTPGRFWWRRGYLTEGQAWLERFLALEAEAATPARVRAQIAAGDLAAWQKQIDRATAWHTEALDLSTRLGDAWGIAAALDGLANDAIDQADPARAEPLLAESLARYQALGDVTGIGTVRDHQGRAALAQGDHERAAAYFAEALVLFRTQQDWRYVSATLEGMVQVAFARGDAEQAREPAAEALALSARLGDKTGIAWGLMNLAGVAAATDQAEAAARLLSAASAQIAVIGVRLGPVEQANHNRIETAARAALGAAAFLSAWDEGAALPLAAAIAEATAVAQGAEPSRPPALPPSRPALTRRELEVLRLVAAGLTDRQIAEQLFLSRRTVSKHVESILAKLAVPSRGAAASAAVRLGLA